MEFVDRTIHGMVYNALKLFMEINSDYFAEAMEQYKQHKIESVDFIYELSCFFLTLIFVCREQQHAVTRYEAWQKLRKLARQNAPNGQLPPSFVDREPTPPPPPVPEEDLLDLNMDFNAISIDAEGDLDESGIERVPMADPGMDVSYIVYLKGDLSNGFFPATFPRGWC
jgi:serine/threonine-protein phosphatase 2A regulatory subunit B'